MDNKVQSITSKLWAMANELRGNMDASEFKNYILAFMFYRYLSEHQENYMVEYGIIDSEDGMSNNEVYKRDSAGDLDTFIKDIADELGYAIYPDDTWESLCNKIDEGKIVPSDYQKLLDNFNNNARINERAEEDFSGVFNDINLGDSKLGASATARARSLNNIVKLVDEVEYKGEDGKDILGEIYEYLIGQFAASAGKKGGEFYTPHQVSQILAKIVTTGRVASKKTFNLYDPTMGSGSLLLTVRDELPGGDRVGAMDFYGQELNTTTYNLARMNLMMHGVEYKNMSLKNGDTLEEDWPIDTDKNGKMEPKWFDAVVANPPYSAKWDNNERKIKDPRFNGYGKLAPASKADFAFILHSVYHLKEDGTMAIVLPHGVLFRGAAEGVIRKNLIEKDNYLDAVIGLPANLFYGTSIPTTILVFKKDRTARGVSDVLFIDASSDFVKGKNQNTLTDEFIDKIVSTYRDRKAIDKYSYIASLDEIKGNDYNLNIPRYVDTFEEEEPVDLIAVSKLIEEDNKEIAKLESEIMEQLRILGLEV